MADDNQADPDAYGYQYQLASGPSQERCAFACYRWNLEHGFDFDEMDSWVVLRIGGTTGTIRGYAGHMTGLWYSDDDQIFCTLNGGRLEHCPDATAPRGTATWRSEEPGIALGGVWGLDSTHVYAWGGLPDRRALLCFDGKRWNAMPAPPGVVQTLRGVSPSCLYAVGNDGLVAHWDGRGWRRISMPTEQTFVGLHVESEDEVYASGRGGLLYEGSADGFIERARWNGPLQGCAKFAGHLWVGAGEAGLLRLEDKGNRLEVYKDNIPTDSIEARQHLLIADDVDLCWSEDGSAFFSDCEGLVRDLVGHETPIFEQ